VGVAGWSMVLLHGGTDQPFFPHFHSPSQRSEELRERELHVALREKLEYCLKMTVLTYMMEEARHIDRCRISFWFLRQLHRFVDLLRAGLPRDVGGTIHCRNLAVI